LKWHSDIADVWVHTDPELVRRITANLLSNAVRYTNRGTVSLVARADGAKVRLVVSDTGIGIAPEEQGRVFEEFVQLDNPSRERDRGVGLGLSIVKKVSELLQANLTLKSAIGEGTEVSVEIPLAAAAAPRVQVDAATTAGPTEFAGLRLWVVEDDPIVRDALASQFAAWGVDYAFAVDRAEVEALLQSDGGWPDAAMLDDMLGHGERGLEIARWIGSNLPRERIVLVTGNVEPAGARALEESGFAVLRKPLSSAILAQWLDRAARSAREATGSPAGAPAG
jgi:CheY-like chemotaxis protein